MSDIPIQSALDLDDLREKAGVDFRPTTTHRDENMLQFESPDVQLSFTDPRRPPKKKEYFVSYAWGDDSADGEERNNAIEQLCSSAEKRGVEIIRDVTHIKVGELISKFMERIGKGDKIFIILSDKYLRSKYCMFGIF